MSLTEKQIKEICKMDQGEGCCRYLTIDGGRWACAKLTPLKSMLDRRVDEGKMRAKGDNCEGVDMNAKTN